MLKLGGNEPTVVRLMLGGANEPNEPALLLFQATTVAAVAAGVLADEDASSKSSVRLDADSRCEADGIPECNIAPGGLSPMGCWAGIPECITAVGDLSPDG
jgi:hypothetical protein